MMAANIAFGPRQRGERLSEQIAMLLERVGLPGYQERDASNLSEGEAQPVLPARTFGELADGSPVEDEPTSALKKQDGSIGINLHVLPLDLLAIYGFTA
jgi:putative ABC transport system ATP-binding protein